jgi:hypothetical protein
MHITTAHRWVDLETRNVSYKTRKANQNTYFKLNIFFSENRVVCEITRKKYGTAGEVIDDNIIRRMRYFTLDN